MAKVGQPILEGFIEWGAHAGGHVVGNLSKATLCTQLCASPDVHMFRVPFDNGPTKATNCYVLRSQGQALLVDTGAALDDNALIVEAALGELGLGWDSVTYFLTHLHTDHAQLAHEKAPLQAPIYVGRTEYESAMAEHSAESVEELAAQWVIQGVSHSYIEQATQLLRYWNSPLAAERNLLLVEQDDIVPVGNLRLRVIETPGHTVGHLSLYEPQSGILFGGDHILFDIAPVLSGHSTTMNSVRAYLSALDRVQELGITRLFHSHGDIRPDFEQRINELKNHQRERAEEACRKVAETPGSLGIDVVKSLSWSALARFGSWDAMPLLTQLIIVEAGIAVLGYVLEEGRVAARLDSQGFMRYYPVE